MMTRKSTPKYEVVTVDSKVVIHAGISRTRADRFAADMNVGGRKSVEVRFVKPCA